MAEGARGLVARRAALDLLDRVLGERVTLDEAAGALEAMAPAEQARARRLAALTLRGAKRADRLLGPYLKRRPPERVLNALRLGTCEMLAAGAPAHGVVNAVVSLLGEGRRTRGMAGMANAVLRRIAAAGTDWSALPPPELPKWLRRPLIADWGKAAVQAIEAVQAAEPPLDLTPRDGDADALAAAVGGTALPTGSVRLAGPVQVSALPGYAEGAFWVQDAAAALPARALGAGPGMRVLDLCAAPGGKTLQLAAAGARVTALDISAPRMARLAENLARCGLEAQPVVADALDWAPDAPFDAVLLDAPCSATGTIRRHPELPLVRDGAGLEALVALQARLIDRALEMLAPGGRLVFATCSLLKAEGEDQLAAALARHPGLATEPGALRLPGVAPGWIGAEGGLRLRPDLWAERGGMDGFFVAALRKPAEAALGR